MDSSRDSLLDPLLAADPAKEDGPAGTHFGNTFDHVSDKRTGAQIQTEKSEKRRSSNVRPVKTNYPTPPTSASPSRAAFPDFNDNPFGNSIAPSSPRQSSEIPTSTMPSATASINEDNLPRRRGSSLGARFAGDNSHRPLDMLRADAKAANRHARRSQRVGSDSIDHLDQIGLNGAPYHHDGPYDATLMGRNLNSQYSPVAATARTNEEAIRATPREFIADSVRGHRPLAGVATVPPGESDRYGRVLNYKEGPNLNVEMGWRRWEGIDYHPDDIKGKGEPYFTIDRALKDHKKTSHRRIMSEGGIELTDRRRSSSNPWAPARGSHLKSASGVDAHDVSGINEEPYSEWSEASAIRRSNTTGKHTSSMTGAIKSRFGSLRKRKPVGSTPVEKET